MSDATAAPSAAVAPTAEAGATRLRPLGGARLVFAWLGFPVAVVATFALAVAQMRAGVEPT